MSIRIPAVAAAIALATALPLRALDLEPPEEECLKFGDEVLLEGIVAERGIRMKSDGTKTDIYLFRPAPICVLEKDGKKKVDKLRLIATVDKSQYSALSLVSGNRVRVSGKLVQVADPIIVANAIDISSVSDLEADGGPAIVQPEIPLSVSFRDALLSSGKVAQFRNRQAESLAVTVEFFRPATGNKVSQDLVIDPMGKKEVGEREGWAFVKDDRITVTRKGMKTFTVITP